MLLLVGLGFGHIFNLYPHLSLLIKITGTVYLVYLAYLIAKSRSVENGHKQAIPLGFLKGALFQWVNAKAWVVAIGAITAFTTAGEQNTIQNLAVATTFFLLSFPCVGVWLIFGTLLRQKLENDVYLRRLNMSMAFLLLLSVFPVIRDIWQQLS
ncbi:transporter protein [Vibrio sp. MEBiC08052]|nr:transporter protein [Vibrio sp. MEBiC08052]